MTNEQLNVKYVDLQGLRLFAEELKKWLESHVVETDIYKELLYRIENLELYKIVETLPEEGDENTIYLLKNPNEEDKNLFIEYLYNKEHGWEEIGKFTPNIKLEDYLKIEDSPFEKGEAENSAVLKGEYEGYSNKAISQTSMAVGAGTIAGLKGWYYSNIDFTNKKITLSDKKVTNRHGVLNGGGWSSGTPNIKLGDVISIVNNSKFDFCSKVTIIDGYTITVDSLPFNSIANGVFSAIDDNTIYIPNRPHAGIIDFGGGAFAEGGINTKASNICAHAEGLTTHAYGQYSHTEGRETKAGYAAHAEGNNTTASGNASHSEGYETSANAHQSHTEGWLTSVDEKARAGHAEGYNTRVGGKETTLTAGSATDGGIYSHAEGNATQAIGYNSHAEGKLTKALGAVSHTEGVNTVASGYGSHAEGVSTKALKSQSHAEGEECVANGQRSHAEGYFTETTNQAEHAQGKYNKSNTNTIHSVGIGSNAQRKNAHEIMQDGKHYIYNLGGYDGTNPTSTNDLVTYIKSLETRIKELEDKLNEITERE